VVRRKEKSSKSLDLKGQKDMARVDSIHSTRQNVFLREGILLLSVPALLASWIFSIKSC
jgi:hypothetical protein